MKPLKSYLRTGALAVGLLGVTAAQALAGASPAAAATAYGSGAAVQKAVQGAWLATGHWSPPSGDSINYNPTTSGGGQLEFGLDTSSLDATQDSAANPVLDGYVATDSPPTPTEAANADTAAGTGTQNLLSIPVAQVSEVIELNVPSGITLNSAQTINLTNQLAAQLFAGTVPASAHYSADTWGALLEDSGLALVTSAPSVGQFEDSGTSGGSTAISLELRANGAGATLTLKQYLSDVAAQLKSTDWSSILIDESTSGTNEWPSGATVAGRAGSDSAQAGAVAATAGLAGYGTLGAALTAGFVDSPGASGTHTLIARLQDNGVGTTGVKYANAEATSGASNVYTGTSINTSGTYNPGAQTGAGNWVVPNTGGTLNTTGQWATNGTTVSDYTHGWDTDVYDDTGKGLTLYYPLDIVVWDLSWGHSAWGTGNLKGTLYPTPTGTNSVEETVTSYFKYVTGTGQSDTVGVHFAPLPSGGSGLANIDADAAAIAAAL